MELKLNKQERAEFFECYKNSHNTFSSSKYFDLHKLSDNILKKIIKFSLKNAEVENSSYTVGIDMGFIRFNIPVQGEVLECEIDLGEVDIKHSDYNWNDELDSYVTDENEPIDSDLYAERFLQDLLSVVEFEHLTVYVTKN